MKMPFLSLLLLGALLPCAHAQSPDDAPDAGWTRVQAVPAGTVIAIKTRQKSLSCRFLSATANDLTCDDHGSPLTLPKADIRLVRIHHRVRSALVGFGIGAAGGSIAGAASCESGQIINRQGCAEILGIPLGLIGGIVGASSDFTRNTLYKSR